MIYTIGAVKIPGTIEKAREIELPDGAIPLKVETMLEHEIDENETDVFVGLYADKILYYSDKEMSFNEDRTKVTIDNNKMLSEDEKGSITYNTFFRIRYLIPKELSSTIAYNKY